KLDRLSLPLRCNPHRKYDLVVIADRRAVSVGEAMRRGIEHLGELQILRAGEIEARRHAGIAGVPPISLPAAIHAKLHASKKARLTIELPRARDESHFRIGGADPGRLVRKRRWRWSQQTNGQHRAKSEAEQRRRRDALN